MPKQKRKNSIAIITFLLLLVSGTAIIIYLKDDTKYTIIGQASSEVSSNTDTSHTESTVSQTSEDSTLHTVPLSLTDSSTVHSLTSEQVDQLISDIPNQDYKEDLLTAQSEIVEAIQKNKQDIAELGYLFLPTNPAQTKQLQAIKQLDVPLFLQKDPKWRSLAYGSNTTKELGENGCAILSLAMVHAYYTSDSSITPQTILDWSNDKYYVHNQGTSWNIFYDFAQQFGYKFMNYGEDFYGAMTAVNNGEVIIASVKPGLFTEFGHILVIRGYDNGNVYVNDPNDDASKMFSLRAIPEQTLLDDGVNFWALSK